MDISKCVCGSEATVRGIGKAPQRWVACLGTNKGGCWTGPVAPTEEEAIVAWNALMKRFKEE